MSGKTTTVDMAAACAAVAVGGCRIESGPSRVEPTAMAVAQQGGRLIDDKEKTFVFVGDATSYRWPNILELNRQRDDQIVYQAMDAAGGCAPWGGRIATPRTRDCDRSSERMPLDWFLSMPSHAEQPGRRRCPYVPAPTIARLQRSLQLSTP